MSAITQGRPFKNHKADLIIPNAPLFDKDLCHFVLRRKLQTPPTRNLILKTNRLHLLAESARRVADYSLRPLVTMRIGVPRKL
jgi:hypothetical protein